MSTERAQQIQTMFGRIVRRYDLLNRLMSLGMDSGWRRSAATAARPSRRFVLDVGTGTGDLAVELHKQGAEYVVGVDFSLEMLTLAQEKSCRNDARAGWLLADALRLPFPDDTFDSVTNAFLLRNLVDLPAGLQEMARVLKPGGHLVCLDMTRPPPGPFGSLYRLYFNRLLPPLAGAISGDSAAYRYLPNSLSGFHDASALAIILTDIGLTEVRVRRLAGGTVALHTARKPVSAY